MIESLGWAVCPCQIVTKGSGKMPISWKMKNTGKLIAVTDGLCNPAVVGVADYPKLSV
jgi:hypothetical protein